jgi:hypothetical protein
MRSRDRAPCACGDQWVEAPGTRTLRAHSKWCSTRLCAARRPRLRRRELNPSFLRVEIAARRRFEADGRAEVDPGDALVLCRDLRIRRIGGAPACGTRETPRAVGRVQTALNPLLQFHCRRSLDVRGAVTQAALALGTTNGEQDRPLQWNRPLVTVVQANDPRIAGRFWITDRGGKCWQRRVTPGSKRAEVHGRAVDREGGGS